MMTLLEMYDDAFFLSVPHILFSPFRDPGCGDSQKILSDR